jgi:hypothetical protein
MCAGSVKHVGDANHHIENLAEVPHTPAKEVEFCNLLTVAISMRAPIFGSYDGRDQFLIL